MWHIGYEDGGDNNDGRDKSDDDKDEEWQDSEFDGDDEISSMKEVSEQIGKLSSVNRLDADSSLVKSTDSRFGSDPRFSKTVNEELRVSRLKGWICKVLVETAKKTGGRCRKVIIEELRIDANRMNPWCLDDLTSMDEEEW